MTSSGSIMLFAAIMCWASLATGQTSTPAPAPTPTPPSCPPLVEPQDGAVTVSGQTEGSTATYSCNPGFDLVGEATATCTGGSWSSAPPICRGASTAPTQAPTDISTAAAADDATTATQRTAAGTSPAAMADATSKASMTDGEHDGDNDGHEGDDDDDEEDHKGLKDNQIALAVLATFLIVGTLAVFLGLCYWKYKGTSYVTVTSDTTYRQ